MSELAVHLVVDVANVLGSRPDGWWRDRAGAAGRLLERIAALHGADVPAPGEDRTCTLASITAVLEGRAKTAAVPAGIDAILAPADGDSAIVDAAARLHETSSGAVLVVTADRGLRDRLTPGIRFTGPDWLNARIGR